MNQRKSKFAPRKIPKYPALKIHRGHRQKVTKNAPTFTYNKNSITTVISMKNHAQRCIIHVLTRLLRYFCPLSVFGTRPTRGDTPRSTARKVENRKCDKTERRKRVIRTPMDRASDSLSIGVEHSRNGPRFLSELGFLSRRSGNVHSGRDRSGGDTRDSDNRSPRIGQIERRIADLQKERKIPRLLTVFALTFVFCRRREIRPRSRTTTMTAAPHPDDTGRRKERRHNSKKQGSPRTNGGSTESPWDEEFADVKITHCRAHLLLFHPGVKESNRCRWAPPIRNTTRLEVQHVSISKKDGVSPDETHINRKSIERAARWCVSVRSTCSVR